MIIILKNSFLLGALLIFSGMVKASTLKERIAAMWRGDTKTIGLIDGGLDLDDGIDRISLSETVKEGDEYVKTIKLPTPCFPSSIDFHHAIPVELSDDPRGRIVCDNEADLGRIVLLNKAGHYSRSEPKVWRPGLAGLLRTYPHGDRLFGKCKAFIPYQGKELGLVLKAKTQATVKGTMRSAQESDDLRLWDEAKFTALDGIEGGSEANKVNIYVGKSAHLSVSGGVKAGAEVSVHLVDGSGTATIDRVSAPVVRLINERQDGLGMNIGVVEAEVLEKE